MTTVLDDNVHNFGVDGSSDDLDVPIKVVIFVTIIKRMMIFIKKWIMMIIIMMTMVKHHYDN